MVGVDYLDAVFGVGDNFVSASRIETVRLCLKYGLTDVKLNPVDDLYDSNGEFDIELQYCAFDAIDEVGNEVLRILLSNAGFEKPSEESIEVYSDTEYTLEDGDTFTLEQLFNEEKDVCVEDVVAAISEAEGVNEICADIMEYLVSESDLYDTLNSLSGYFEYEWPEKWLEAWDSIENMLDELQSLCASDRDAKASKGGLIVPVLRVYDNGGYGCSYQYWSVFLDLEGIDKKLEEIKSACP